MSAEKYGWVIQKSLFAYANQDFTFFHTRENSNMFSITSKYFSLFDNKPPASWVAHITRDFFTRYSCSYYSSMLKASISSNSNWHWASEFLKDFMVWRYSNRFCTISYAFYTIGIWINFKSVHFECYRKISFISTFETREVKMGNWKTLIRSMLRWFNNKLRWC